MYVSICSETLDQSRGNLLVLAIKVKRKAMFLIVYKNESNFCAGNKMYLLFASDVSVIALHGCSKMVESAFIRGFSEKGVFFFNFNNLYY